MSKSNWSGHIPDELDPDYIHLSKKEIELFLDILIQRAKSGALKQDSKKAYLIYVTALKGMKGAIFFTPEKIIEKIWNDILRGFNKLLYYNSLSRAMAESKGNAKKQWEFAFEKFKEDLKRGDIF